MARQQASGLPTHAGLLRLRRSALRTMIRRRSASARRRIIWDGQSGGVGGAGGCTAGMSRRLGYALPPDLAARAAATAAGPPVSRAAACAQVGRFANVSDAHLTTGARTEGFDCITGACRPPEPVPRTATVSARLVGGPRGQRSPVELARGSCTEDCFVAPRILAGGCTCPRCLSTRQPSGRRDSNPRPQRPERNLGPVQGCPGVSGGTQNRRSAALSHGRCYPLLTMVVRSDVVCLWSAEA